MTLHLPTLLALLGAALMAVAIFVPQKPATQPMPPAPRIGRTIISTWHAPPIADVPAMHATPVPAALTWPALVDAHAIDCNVDARRQIALALGALGEPWCKHILRRALDEEPDAGVRLALLAGVDVGELALLS